MTSRPDLPQRTDERTDERTDALRALLEPVLAAAGFDLYDVECVALASANATVRVLVDYVPLPAGPVGTAEGAPGEMTPTLVRSIDMDGVSRATSIVSDLLDAVDPIDGPYQLEVSSPGLERPLRTPAHFTRHVGATISVKTKPGTAGERRLEGRLEHADPEDGGSLRVDGRVVAYADVERARTVFVWGPSPKPGAGSRPAAHNAAKPAGSTAANTPRAGAPRAGAGRGTTTGKHPMGTKEGATL